MLLRPSYQVNHALFKTTVPDGSVSLKSGYGYVVMVIPRYLFSSFLDMTTAIDVK